VAATFAGLVAAVDRVLVTIAAFRPSLRLSGWTATGGAYTNTYQIACARFTLTEILTGGLDRRVVGLRENNTALTEQASIAAVDASAGSWYWDADAGVLYAHSTTGSDPDLFTVYHAIVEFRFATTGLVLNLTDGNADTGVYHWPWLPGELPSMISEVEDLLSGQKLTATGQVVLTNTHQAFHRLIANDGDYMWKNKKVTFYIGGRYNGQDLAWSQYAEFLTMLVDDVACDEQACVFQLKPLARVLNIQVPVNPFFSSDYANLGDGVEGTKKPILYGRATFRPALTDTSGSGVYTLADAAKQTLFAIATVSAIHKTTGVRTALTETTHYTKDLTACTVTVVDATYAWADYLLEVDATGKPDGAGSYLKTFGQIVPDLLTTFAGVSTDDIDSAAFAACDIDAPEELSVYLDQPRSLASILSTSQPDLPSLERSVLGTLQQTLGGQWTAWIYDPGYDAATVTTLRKEDFRILRPEPKLEALVGETEVYYARNYSTGAWPSVTATNPVVQFMAETEDRQEVRTFLRETSAATTLAQRLQLVAGSQSLEVEFTERGALLATKMAGDKVLITYDPAPAAAGQWANKPFEIIRLAKSPNLLVTGRFSDLRGVGQSLGHWVDSTAPDYSSATPIERDASGFWADSAGLIDPTDPATLNQSVWW
jgi:hypothetical protein